MSKHFSVRRLLRIVLSVLLALILAVVFYVAVILGQPQSDLDETFDRHQPLLTASPAMHAEAGAENTLISAFPGPVLCPVPDSGWTVLDGESCDVPYENGLARMLTLRCRTDSGAAATVVSIYPARALSLISDQGLTLTGAGPALAGMPSVRMDGVGELRLHAQGSACLYIVTLPVMDADVLAELVRPLTLAGG